MQERHVSSLSLQRVLRSDECVDSGGLENDLVSCLPLSKGERGAKPISVLNGMFSICDTGNTRVIKQASLQKFQEEMDKVMKDPYKVVMKQSKLPMSLLHDRVQPHVRQRALLVLRCLGQLWADRHCFSLWLFPKQH